MIDEDELDRNSLKAISHAGWLVGQAGAVVGTLSLYLPLFDFLMGFTSECLLHLLAFAESEFDNTELDGSKCCLINERLNFFCRKIVLRSTVEYFTCKSTFYVI